MREISQLAALLLGAALAGAVLAERMQEFAPTRLAPGGERRTALVMGNSAYKSSPLRNPVHDARAMARALAETGFAVTLLEDASQSGMRRAIRVFGDELLRGGVGLFYYAGHGMQVRGKNYLVPVNADIQREDEVEDQAVDANLVLSKMDSARNSLNLMILDACRNNPFARSFRSAAQGLAQMDAPSGTLVAFATAPGQVAADGEGENGLYTTHLLQAIRQPGLPVEQLFKQVRVGVTKATGDRQVPWESSSLKGDFFFLPGAASGQAMSEGQLRKIVEDALAEQRAQFEQELKQRGVALAPSAASPPAAPSPPAAGAGPGWPKPGDRWLYRGWNSRNPERKNELAIEVKAVTASAVLDVTRSADGGVREWAHTDRLYLAGAGPGVVVFPPYLLAFRPLKVGERWSDIPFIKLGKCSNNPLLRCSVRAEVAARERITVAAGTFDAYRVVVTVSWSGPRGRAGGSHDIVYWYAESAKRMVRYRSQSGGENEPAVEIELASYRLN